MSLTLKLSDRIHEIIRQTSIRTLQEALIELITNADDAYMSIKEENKRISIIVNRQKGWVNVLDQAIGMTKEELENNLLVVGSYTAKETSRGMMGRGAKDCSFLGNVRFISIKNNVLNELVIYQNRTADFIRINIPVDREIRKEVGIDANGCLVRLEVNPSLIDPIEQLGDSLSKNIYLRELLQQDKTVLTLIENEANYNKRLVYRRPEGKLIISCEYKLPLYGATAYLELYRTQEPLSYSINSDLNEYGILVESNQSVYECSALYHSSHGVQDYMWSPNIRYITGKLRCDKIDQIARQAANGDLSNLNPYFLLDSNRRNGLVRDHPFTIALFQPAYRILEIAVGRVQDSRDESLLDTTNIGDILKSLSQTITSILPSDTNLYTWRTKSDHQSLVELTQTIDNVNIDKDFIGMSWDEVKNLAKNRVITYPHVSEQTPGTFEILLSDDPKIDGHYQVNYLPNKIVIKIKANDISIAGDIEIKDGKVSLINSDKAIHSIKYILTEVVTNLMLRKHIVDGNSRAVTMEGFNECLNLLASFRKKVAGGIFQKN